MNGKDLILGLFLGVLLCYLAYVMKIIPREPPVETVRIDTVYVKTTVDSLQIGKEALIKARGKIAQYNILPDGTWVKRDPKIIYLPGDTTKIFVNVAELDTSFNYAKDSAEVSNKLNLKFAPEIGALSFNFETFLNNLKDTSYYKFKLKGNYKDSLWNVLFSEDFNIKSKTTVITKEIYIETKPNTSFWDRVVFGPEVGVGYGTFNKVFDTFVGFGILYNVK